MTRPGGQWRGRLAAGRRGRAGRGARARSRGRLAAAAAGAERGPLPSARARLGPARPVPTPRPRRHVGGEAQGEARPGRWGLNAGYRGPGPLGGCRCPAPPRPGHLRALGVPPSRCSHGVVSPQEGVKTENDHINLKVAGQDGSVVQFKIKRHTPLSKLMKAYCERQVRAQPRRERAPGPEGLGPGGVRPARGGGLGLGLGVCSG